MERRDYLRILAGAIAVGGSGGLAGCLAPTRSSVEGVGSSANETLSRNRRVEQVAGVDLPLPRSEIQVPLGSSIPAILEPAFGPDWSGVDWNVPAGTDLPRLAPEDPVIGVVRDGVARAYPLRVLTIHEAVNDRFPDGEAVVVTYCPLCDSGVVASRVVDGEPRTFTVSGLLWHSNLLLYDEGTRSLWSQISMTAVRGDLTGVVLDLVPASFTTWGEWRESHPDGSVLLPPPDSRAQFGTVPPARRYEEVYDERQVGVSESGELRPWTHVLGVEAEGVARAYPRPVVASEGVVNDVVGDRPVVVTLSPSRRLVGYERSVGGETLTFENVDSRHLSAGGSRWSITTGEAVDGPHEGERLASATALSEMTWRTWAAFRPETTVYSIT